MTEDPKGRDSSRASLDAPAQDAASLREEIAARLPREAALLLKNLLDRLDADAEADRPQYRGVVSDAERDALRAMLRVWGGPASPVRAPTERTARTLNEQAAEVPLPAAELNTAALDLDRSPAPDWVLCLDFGTAKSKAFAATDDAQGPELAPLPIGLADQDLDGAVHEVASCVWISDDCHLFVGSEAVKRGMNYGGDRQPLASLKQVISQVDPEDGATELERVLPKEVDPNSTLTYGDAITIYLAYLTDLATATLDELLGTRYVRRRFTVPAWKEPQRRWAADWIGTRVLRAQLLADTFSGRWRGGIPVQQIKEAIRAAEEHEAKLTWLAAADSENLSDWDRGTLEALAAASARLWTDGSARNLMLVVDVGAGTTDLSLFWVVQEKGKSHLAWLAEGAVAVGLRQAGDTLDELLVEVLVEKAGLATHQAGDRARKVLRRRVRRSKEALFKKGSIAEDLPNDETIKLSEEEFVGSAGVQRFSEFIAEKIQKLLDGVHTSWKPAAELHGLTMVLTGGGCDLPMIKDLVNREWRLDGSTVRIRRAHRVPDGVVDRFDEDFVQEYPRLAVAMGGALNMRLDEKNPLREWMGGAGAPGRLESFPMKGV